LHIQEIVLKPKREKSALNRHPWIFSGAVAKLPDAKEGDIIKVMSSEQKFLGYGFFAIKSQITVRLFEFNQVDENILLNKDYWINKITSAFTFRKEIFDFNQTNAFRLIHAEGDFFPGVICDVYGNIAVIQVLIQGTEKIIEYILEGIHNCGIDFIYNKSKTSSKMIENITLEHGWISKKEDAGQYPSTSIVIKENGLLFNVDIEHGQKTGFFIDQRVNRDILGQFSKGKVVLNTFCYSGGFSVYAGCNDAKQVDSVDISKDAIEQCIHNLTLNQSQSKSVILNNIAEDVFEYLKNMPSDLYDIIVLDPPAFAKNASSVPQASRGYKQINLQAFRKIKKGGYVFTFSCSQNITTDLFRKIVFSAAADAYKNVRIIQQLHQPFDHPINIYHPEGEYLKGFLLKVE